jgi:hypothetical protein
VNNQPEKYDLESVTWCLFLESTLVSVAPGIFAVDVAAKPPGKTFGVLVTQA